MKGAWILSTNKLSSKEIYLILISSIVNKPTSNIYFEKSFENTTLNWSKIYLLLHLAIIDTTLHSFQDKIFNNLLFLSKELYNIGITNMLFSHFVRLLKNLPYISFVTALMLNLFWKNYRRNFRMILSCHHLHHRLPFLDWLMKQKT